MKFLICSGLILAGGFLLSCRLSNGTGRTNNVLTEQRLSELMAPVKSWEDWSSQGYSSNDWSHLVAAAEVIQTSDSKSVKKAMWQYQLGGHPEKEFYDMPYNMENDTKLFLLMRVVFQLPESVPERRLILSGAWNPGAHLLNSDGTINQSWPIKWGEGHPKIVAPYAGMEGFYARYDAGGEYMSLLAKYPKRDLSSFAANH